MTEHMIPQRDHFVASHLQKLDVPAPRPDFWDTLTSRLDDVAAGVDPEDQLEERDHSNGEDPVAPTVDLASRARPGQSRTTWLAIAAAVTALLVGAFALSRMADQDSTTLIDVAGEDDADQGDPNTEDNGAPPADGSASVATLGDADYASAPTVSLLGPGAVSDATNLDAGALVTFEAPGTDGQGCEAVDPLSSVRLLSTSGALSDTGVAALSWPAVHISPTNRVVVTTFCEGFTSLEAVGVMAPNGTITVADMPADGPATNLVGEPVWSLNDELFTVTNFNGEGLQNLTFDTDGRLVGAEPTDGVLLGFLPEGTEGVSVEVVDDMITVGGIDHLATSSSVRPQAAVDPTGTEVAVAGDHGVYVIGGDNPSGNLIYQDEPVLDIAYSSRGDLALVVGIDERSVVVIDEETGLGQVWVVETGLDRFVPDGLTWTENGRSLIVSGSTEQVADSAWLIRFGLAGESGSGEAPVDDGQESAPEGQSEETVLEPETEEAEAADGGDDITSEIPNGDSEGLVNYAYEDLDTGVIKFVDEDMEVRDVIAMYPAENVDNQLAGTIEIGATTHVVYEHIEFVPGASPEGTVILVADDLDITTENWIIEDRRITGIDGSWFYTSRVARVGDVLWLERSFHQGACYWIDVVDLEGNPTTDPANPWPRPDVDLDEVSAAQVGGDIGALDGVCSPSPLL